MVSSVLFTAIILMPLMYVGKFLLKYLRDLYILRNIPTVKGKRFLFGHTFVLKSEPADFYQQLLGFCKEHIKDPVFKFWIGPRPVIICNHPSSVEAILGSNEIISKSALYNIFNKWLGFGVLTADGSKWHSKRKLLTPSFHFSILQNYYPIMNEHARKLVDVVDEKLSRLPSDSPVIDIFPMVISSALDVLCETTMGHNLDSLTKTNHQYAIAVNRMTDVIMERVKYPHLLIDFIFDRTALGREHDMLVNIIHNFSSKVIADRRQEMKEIGYPDEIDITEMSNRKKKWTLAFLDLLLHEQHVNGTLTDSDIQQEVDTFMFEGHDTTAAAMTWCLYNVGLDSRVQGKLHQELDEVFLSRTCEITNEHIGKLEYLNKVIKESLRLFPSVPIFGREVKSDFILNSFPITAGSTIWIMPPALHRNPEFFTNAEEFYPERFDEISRHPYAYVPFSAGPRNCIGTKFAQLEMKITLSWFLRNYSIKTLKDAGSVPAGNIILKPIKGINLEIRKRE